MNAALGVGDMRVNCIKSQQEQEEETGFEETENNNCRYEYKKIGGGSDDCRQLVRV